MTKEMKGSGEVSEYLKKGKEYAMVPVQRVQARCKKGLMTVLWDPGSNVNLI